MRAAFDEMIEYYMVGRFVAYEIVCDFRHTPLLNNATDKLTWANMGPGAKRGLKRLGMPHKGPEQGIDSMVRLYKTAKRYVGSHLRPHIITKATHPNYPPFELREIEHSLCEFDKYERVRTGAGRPRELFDGK